MNGRRLKRFAVTPDLFVEMAKAKTAIVTKVIEHALPADAEYVMATFDLVGGLVWIWVQSESFDIVPVNAKIPELPAPIFEKIADPVAVERIGRELRAMSRVSLRKVIDAGVLAASKLQRRL